MGFNFESSPNSFDVKVKSTDQGGLSTDETPFIITVTNINEAPTSVGLDTLTVAEHAGAVKVGTFSVTDPDAGGSHTYELTDGMTNFEIKNGNELWSKVGFNFESSPNSFDVKVKSTDQGGLSTDETPFIITVTNINEAPTSVGLDTLTVAEHAGAVKVGTFSVTDPDAGGSHTYELTDGMTNFEIKNGNELWSKVGFNFESSPNSFDVKVKSTDQGGLSTDETPFIITVTNINEAPTSVGLDTLTVAEHAGAVKVGTFSVTDPDAGGSHTYELTDGMTNFEIKNGNELWSKVGFNFESSPNSFDVKVKSTDQGGLSTDETHSS